MAEARHEARAHGGAGERGRYADRPSDIPKRGWLDVAKRVKASIAEDNVSLVAAGVAHFALLAVFPMLAAMVLIYGLVASPERIQEHMSMLTNILPADAAAILQTQLEDLAAQGEGTLGIGLVLTLLVTLWSARLGMAGLMAAMNIVYDEDEERSFVKKALVSLGLTLGFIFGVLVMLAITLLVPVVVRIAPLGPVADPLILGARWVLLAVFIAAALAVVYRYAPDRSRPAWRWVSWGSGFATVAWLAASLLFAFYVRNFGSYNETYGTLGGAIILILWFYISAFVVVLGGEIDAELERQTLRDTTTGEPRKMGNRGAQVADEPPPVHE